MKGNGNFPSQQVSSLPEDFTRKTIQSLMELNEKGKPKTNRELQERIDDYFQFCARSGCRPGVEGLCMSLHISRTTLFRWSHGQDCDPQRQEIIERAKMFIASFLEQAILRGKVSPPSGIFLLKNWCSYKDTLSFENIDSTGAFERPPLSQEEIRGLLSEMDNSQGAALDALPD